MDEAPKVEQATPETDLVWPHAKAIDGNVYSLVDPNHGNQHMVAMTLATWESFVQRQQVLAAQLGKLTAEKPRIILPNG